jgi:hypothetical protein
MVLADAWVGALYMHVHDFIPAQPTLNGRVSLKSVPSTFVQMFYLCVE